MTSALWITGDFCLIKNSYAKDRLRNQGEVCYQKCNEDKRAEKFPSCEKIKDWKKEIWQNKMRESDQTSLTPIKFLF